MSQPTLDQDPVILSPALRAKVVRIIRDANRKAEARAAKETQAAAARPAVNEPIAKAA